MDYIERFVAFFSAYPLWARVAAPSLFAAGILILLAAPRSSGERRTPPEPSTKDEPPVSDRPNTASNLASTPSPVSRPSPILRVIGVTLDPDEPDAMISLSIHVNAQLLRYPSVGGAEWIKTGPRMSPGVFDVDPKSDGYRVRFEMRYKKDGIEKFAGSQEVQHVTTLPYDGEFRLYLIGGGVREAAIKAIVHYQMLPRMVPSP